MDFATAFLIMRRSAPADFDEAVFFDQFLRLCPASSAGQLITTDTAVEWLDKTVMLLPRAGRGTPRVERHVLRAINRIKDFVSETDGIEYVACITAARIIWREMMRAWREMS